MLGALGRGGSEAAKRVLLRKADKIVAMAEPLTPVDPEDGGELRASVRRTRGTIRRDGTVIVTVLAGGAALKADNGKPSIYPVIQHEDLTLHHTTGGPKFIERPVYQVAPEIPDELHAELAAVAERGQG